MNNIYALFDLYSSIVYTNKYYRLQAWQIFVLPLPKEGLIQMTYCTSAHAHFAQSWKLNWIIKVAFVTISLRSYPNQLQSKGKDYVFNP